ncbi:MAG TPA: HesA/MoeB/ThiF family protein [Methanoregulaceae archaeon]|nr:HesA/MoeB/ThiF family protein [Methanoregulaceae archaeon]
MPAGLTPAEIERYSRQILSFGEEGQVRLKRAHIVIAGAGGLGSPVAIYLAVAGVGRLTLIDHDRVEATNLNRQVLHGDADLGRPKVESGAGRLRALNPSIQVEGRRVTITEENVADLVGQADGIVDAMDNYPVRFLLNRVAYMRGIPLFHGAVRGFHGQATTCVPGQGPCLACLFPDVPPEVVVPVVGVTPGVIGCIQATEVIKYLTGEGELLTGRLLLWDGLAGRMEEIVAAPRTGCPICGRDAPG